MIEEGERQKWVDNLDSPIPGFSSEDKRVESGLTELLQLGQ